jgi:CRP-like cAMP-binding protein
MDSINPNYFIHAANVLLLFAYLLRDMLWLRLLALASSLCAMPYFLLHPKPLWAPLLWSVVFATVNLFQAWRVYAERRPVKLTDEEEEVRRLAFEDLPPKKVLEVLSIGSWSTANPSERLLEQGKRPDAVFLIVRGMVHLNRNGKHFADMVPGNLVGSALLLTGASSDVDAVAAGPVRTMQWELETLDRYLSANPDTRIVMQRHLVHDLAAKLVTYADRVRAA